MARYFFTLVTNTSPTINHPPNHISEEAFFLQKASTKEDNQMHLEKIVNIYHNN